MLVIQLIRLLSHPDPEDRILVSINGCFYFDVGRVSENIGGKVFEIEAVYNPPQEKTNDKKETVNGIAQPVDKSQGVPVDNDAVQQACK